MKQEIKIPEVAEGVTGGTVVALKVAVGDQVVFDQTLLELETDKAVVAIPSPLEGQISEIRVAEGAEVEVGSVVMLLEPSAAPQEQPEVVAPSAVDAAPESSDSAGAEVATEPETPSFGEKEQPVAELPLEQKDGHRGPLVAAAAPSVRHLARELGVDIHQVSGAGPGGRINADDIRLYVNHKMQSVANQGSSAANAHHSRALPDFSRFGPSRREPLSKVRQLTADAMSYAWSTIPMVTQYDKAAIDSVEKFRKEFNRSAGPETRLTMTAFLVKVCAAALRVFPQVNSALDLSRRELILHHFINIGVAVDTPGGLLVPVIREAESKGVEKIAAELTELAARARERRLGPAEMEGGTFTISNLGGIGGSAFTPIVYAPQVAILGVSTAEMQPKWNGSEFEPQLMLPLSLTYDHRVIDGAAGARFLRWICRALENPLNLVMKG